MADSRLRPLKRAPDETWVKFAKTALTCLVSEGAIANASGLPWDTDFNTVEDRYRAEIEAWDQIIAVHAGAIGRVAARRKATRLSALNK